MLLHHALVDAKLRVQSRLHRTGENAQGGKPAFLALVAAAVDGELEQFEELVGAAIGTVLYPSCEYIRFVAYPCAWIFGSSFASFLPMSVLHWGEFGTVKRSKRR